MSEFLYKVRQSPWSFPFLWSFLLHFLIVLAMLFILLPSGEDPNEHVTQSFRVKGIKDLPRIAGEPGGGQTRRFQNPRPTGKEARFSSASSIKDVSLQALMNPSNSLKKVAIEVKATALVQDKHLKGLRALKEEGLIERYVIVSLDPEKRMTADGIQIYPWKLFLNKLWGQGSFV